MSISCGSRKISSTATYSATKPNLNRSPRRSNAPPHVIMLGWAANLVFKWTSDQTGLPESEIKPNQKNTFYLQGSCPETISPSHVQYVGSTCPENGTSRGITEDSILQPNYRPLCDPDRGPVEVRRNKNIAVYMYWICSKMKTMVVNVMRVI